MKEKITNERIRSIEIFNNILKKRVDELEKLTLLEFHSCPICKRETLTTKEETIKPWSDDYRLIYSKIVTYTCQICGTKYTEKEVTKQEIVNEDMHATKPNGV